MADASLNPKGLVDFGVAATLDRRCGVCNWWVACGCCCQQVAGEVMPDMTCALFTARRPSFSMPPVGSQSGIGPMAMPDIYGVAMIAKMDVDRQLVFGWANVAVEKDGTPVVDAHDDSIDPADLEDAAYNHVLYFRDAGEMHQGEALGSLVESFVVTPDKLEKMGLATDALPQGWWVGYHIPDEAAWGKVKSGEYSMFSIQGTAIREAAGGQSST